MNEELRLTAMKIMPVETGIRELGFKLNNNASVKALFKSGMTVTDVNSVLLEIVSLLSELEKMAGKAYNQSQTKHDGIHDE